METNYLIDQDKDLALILLCDHAEIKSFEEKAIDRKLEFLKSVLDRLKPFMEKDPRMEIDNQDMLGIGVYWNCYVNGLRIFTKSIYNENKGWHANHGRVFCCFENIDGIIFASWYSDGHPNPEFKKEWKFTESESLFQELIALEVTNPEKITSVYEAIKDFMPEKK